MLEEIILIGLIIFLAAFNQGLTGFGFALTSIPLLSMVVGIKEAIPLAALCGFVVNIYLTIQLKSHIDFSDIKFLILGSVMGIPLGVFFLSEADENLILKLLALVILLFVLINIAPFIKPFKLTNKWGIFFGFFSGMLGGAFNTNGPPILIYFYLKDWDKFKQKASITGFFIVTSTLIVSSHAISGFTTQLVITHAAYALPFLVTGLLLGSFTFPKISSKLYRKLILLFLTTMSLVLLIQ